MQRLYLVIIILTFTGVFVQNRAQKDFFYYDSVFNEIVFSDTVTAKEMLEKQKKVVKNDTDKADYYLNWYRYNSSVNNLHTGKMSLDSALLFIANDDWDRLSEHCRYEALILYKEIQFEKSIATANDFIEKNGQLLSPIQKAKLYLGIENSLISLEKFDTVKVIGKKVNAILHNSHRTSGIELKVKNWQAVGHAFKYLSQYDSAFYYYEKALGLVSDSDIGNRSTLLISMANVLADKGDAKKAINYYLQVEDLLSGSQFEYVKAHNYYNMGDAYSRMNRMDSAYYYFQRTKNLSQEINYPLTHSYALQGLGSYHQQKGNIDSAIWYYEMSLSFFDDLQNTEGEGEAYLGLAKAYHEKRQNKRAQVYARKALLIAQSNGILIQLQSVYKVLAVLYEENRQLDSALYCINNYHLLKDSITGQQVQNNINELQIKYETRIKEEQNKVLRLELREEAANKQFWILTSLLSVISLVGIVLLFIVVLRIKNINIRHKQHLVEEEQVKKNVLLNKLSDARAEAEFNQKIIKTLEIEKEHSTNLNEASEKLIQKINEKNEWSEFMIEFDILYKDFYKKLKQEAIESLSNNDLKISALIKLKLSNKEMAEILFISVESVKKGKNRLFKKFKLQKGFSSISEMIRSF